MPKDFNKNGFAVELSQISQTDQTACVKLWRE